MIDVSFDRVSKRYRIRRAGQPPRSPLARLRGAAREEFWAVRDVTFEVPHGETTGIIGHNGAGKSTLLKLMSRITAPTSGEIRLNGRVSALIEVGSGFHPELTGRDNVFLSGAILGMKRKEIAEKFDRIVEFSGVEAFIDTPVKWYSSGMYVRLGFAIAAHLDPDILLVDEVLAVGDAAFQVQCHERLADLRRAGTTMLFISHDLASIERLCDRVLLMERGRVVAAGTAREVVGEYQRVAVSPRVAAMADAELAATAPGVHITGVTFHDGTGAEILSATTGGALVARVQYEVQRTIPDAVIEVFYYTRDGRALQCQQSTAIGGGELTLTAGPGAVEFVTPELGLQPGIYSIGATVRERRGAGTLDWYYGRTLLYVEPGKSVRGYFYTPHEWRVVGDYAHADGRRTDV